MTPSSPGAPRTLRSLAGEALAWPEAQRLVASYLDAVARRHDAGRGGSFSSADCVVDEAGGVSLPSDGVAGDGVAAASSAAFAAWEWLADAEGEPEALHARVRSKWPDLGPGHRSLLDRARGAPGLTPAALAQEWSMLSGSGGASLRPLRLRGRSRGLMVTGQYEDLPRGTVGPGALRASRSIVETRLEPELSEKPVTASGGSRLVWAVAAGMLFLAVGGCVMGLAGAVAWFR